MRATVIIPAYNAERYVGAAIASATAQTLRDIEILVVDDASTDGTAAIVRRCAAADPRVRLVTQERNAGPSAARNRAIGMARGRWIAILDADDGYAPERLERLVALGEERQADMAADNLLLEPGGTPMIPAGYLAGPRLLDLAEFVRRNVHDRLHPRCNYGFLKPVFRASFLARHGLRYDETVRFAEDFTLYAACLRLGARWWLTPEPMYRYLVRDDSLTQVQTVHDLGRLRAVQQRLLEEAGGDRRLAALVRRHMRVVDRCFYYRWFTDEVKAGRYRAALAVLARSPAAPGLVAIEALRHAPTIAGKALRGGYRAANGRNARKA